MPSSAVRSPVIVVTDLNFPSDDFQALMLLLEMPEFEIVQIVATDGNTWAEEVAENVSATLAAHGRQDIPIVTLALPSRHTRRGRAYRAFRRGHKSFLGPYLKSETPRAPTNKTSDDGLQAFANIIDRCGGKAIIVSLGPLYPIAALLRQAPESFARVQRIIAMAGKLNNGPGRADFNVWFDPHSAKVVFEAGVEILLLPRNACDEAQIDRACITAIHGEAPAQRRFVADIIGMLAQHGPLFPLIDTIIPFVMADPGLILSSRRGRIHVRRKPLAESGQTYFCEDPAGNVTVIDRLDSEDLRSHLIARSGSFSKLLKTPDSPSDGSDFPVRTWLKQRLFDRPLFHIAVNREGDISRLTAVSLDELDRLFQAAIALLADETSITGDGPLSADKAIHRMSLAAGFVAKLVLLDAIATSHSNGQLDGFAGISLVDVRRRLQLSKTRLRRVTKGDAVLEVALAHPSNGRDLVLRDLKGALESWWRTHSKSHISGQLHLLTD